MKNLIKITFVQGLKDVVFSELQKFDDDIIEIKSLHEERAYISTSTPQMILGCRSILNAYLINSDSTFNPHFLSKHKSIIGELISAVVSLHEKKYFKTFKLSCAGSDTDEVKQIRKYISQTYALTESEDADLEIYIGKFQEQWEVGVRLTKRPLSVRDYQVEYLKGGMNPTIAYAINSLCGLDNTSSYLNVFSGSATLLIEAGLSNNDLKLHGFDIDGKRNAAAITNIKKANLIKSIQLRTADIYNKPDMGMFDVITSDLPFGMQIGEEKDLRELYITSLQYCQKKLNPSGILALYTARTELIEELLTDSLFTIEKTLTLKIPTTVSPKVYLHPKIYICKQS